MRLLFFWFGLAALLPGLASAVIGCGGSSCETCGAGGSTTTTTSETGTGGDGGSGGGTATSTTFLCKGLMCKRGSEVCTVNGDNLGDCTPLPLPCLAPGSDCSCFGDLTSMGCQCQQQTTGDFALFCG